MNRKMYFLEAQKGTVKDLEDFTLLEDASYTAKKLISNQLDKVKIYESIIDDNENIIDKKCIFDYDSLREVPVSINTIDISIDEPEEINNDMNDKFEVSLTDLHNQENQPVEVTDLDNLLAGSFVESKSSLTKSSSKKMPISESLTEDYDEPSDYLITLYEDGESTIEGADQFTIDGNYFELEEMSEEELIVNKIAGFAHLIKDDEDNIIEYESFARDGYENMLTQVINKYTKGVTEGKEKTLPQETADASGKSVVYKNKKCVPNIKEDADPSNVDFIFSSKDKKYPYQMLSRLKSDCDYYLGAGNRADKHLWALNPKDQIAYMKAIYDRLEEKPDWLTLDQINDYKKQMLSEKYSIKEDVNSMTIEDKLNYLNEYPTYRADGFGKVYSRPCKVWDLGLTDEQEEKFFSWLEDEQLSNFWMDNDELSQDIYQSGRMGGHLILDPEVLNPNDFIDVTSYNELIDEYLDNNYYPDNDDDTYTDKQKQEAKEEVDSLINDAYDKLIDFDNRVDQLIENLKMELDGYVTDGESDEIKESKQLNETVLKLPESNETSIWEYFSPEASIKEGLDALEIIKNYLGDIEYIEVNDLYDLQKELSPEEKEIMSKVL